MMILKDKIYNLLEYVGIRSRSYSHSPALKSYDPDDILPYYLNQTKRADYFGPFDASGIPLYKVKRKFVYFPIFISMYALGHLELYRCNATDENLSIFKKNIDWFVLNQNESGEWLTNIKVKKFDILRPWPSAMTQGLAISCLVRAFKVIGDDRYVDCAIKALEPYQKLVEKGGVASIDEGYVFYDEYPSRKYNHVLNGFIFSLWGLYDLIRLNENSKAKSLYDKGFHTLIDCLPRFDISYWSLYHISRGMKNPATIPYHRLHINQLDVMYSISGYDIFKKYQKLWSAYLKKPINALRTLPNKVLWNLIHGL
jgi:heparosan-N-sulfate-glucuronate 5-epimerase